MIARASIIVLFCVTAFAGLPGKKKKDAAPTVSPLDQYVLEAYKNNSAPEALPAAGSIGPQRTLHQSRRGFESQSRGRPGYHRRK